jgi:hypothetical protein
MSEDSFPTFPFSTSKEKYVQADRYIILMARSQNLGHAFVGWGYNDEVRQQCIFPKSFGFYPIDHKKGFVSLINNVQGTIVDDSNSSISKKIIVQVDYKTYEKSIKVFDNWEKKLLTNEQRYSLLNENCIKFLKEVAKAIDLKVPSSTTMFPEKYIENITKLNEVERVEENVWFVDKRKDINISNEALSLSPFKMLNLDLPKKNKNIFD